MTCVCVCVRTCVRACVHPPPHLHLFSLDDRTQQEVAKESTSDQSERQSDTRFHPFLTDFSLFACKELFPNASILISSCCSPVVCSKD